MTTFTSNIDPNQIPGSNTNVFFSENTATTVSGVITSTVNANFTVNSLTFGVGSEAGDGVVLNASNSSTLTLSAGAGTGITVNSGAGPVTINAPIALGASQIWNLAGGTTLTVNGGISGTGMALTVNTSGSGTLVLNDATVANSYTGGTTINGGTVDIFTATSLGAPTGLATINNGTLEVSGGTTITTARNFSLGSTGSTISVDGGTIYSITNTSGSNITGTGTLNVTGAGTLVLNDTAKANTFNGGSLLAGGGTVEIYSSTGLGVQSGLATINNATLEVSGGTTITTNRSFSLGSTSSTISVDGGTTYSITNTSGSNITGTGTLNVTGSGILALNDTAKANTFTGGSNISGGGTVEIYTNTSLGAQTGTAAMSGGTLEAMGSIDTSRNFTLAGASNYIYVTGTPTTTQYEIDGTVGNGTSSGTLNVNGTGTLVLTGSNTYSNGTFVTSGALDLDPAAGAGHSASGTGDVTLSGTGILSTIGGDTIPGNLNVGAGTSVYSGQQAYSSVPTLSVGGAMNFAATNNATLNFNLNTTGGVTSNSSINITGALNFGLTSGMDTINVTDSGATPKTGTYVLMNFASENVVGGDFTLGTHPLLDGNTYTLQNFNNMEELLVVAQAAGNLIWDASGTAGNNPAVDGAGNWINGSMNFVYSTGGQATWDNLGNYSVTIGNSHGAAGTITLTGPIAINNTLTFDAASSGIYTIASSNPSLDTLTLNSANGIVANASAIISAPVVLGTAQSWSTPTGATLTVSGLVSESTAGTALAIGGTGTVELTNSGNSYSGGTTVNGGTLQITSDGSLGNAAGSITINAGTLEVSSSSFGTSRTFTLGSNTSAISVDSGLTYTISTAIGGTGMLNATGVGTLNLTAANSYGAGTTISNGTVNLSGSGTLGTGAATVNSGGTLQLSGISYVSGLPSLLSINGTGTAGQGALFATGSSTYGGAISAATSATIGTTGGLTLTGSIATNGVTLTFAGGGTFSVSGGITGASAGSNVVVNGSTLIVSGTQSTYTGSTTVTNSGTLQLGGSFVLPGTPFTPVTLSGSSSTLDMHANNTAINSLSGGGVVTNSVVSTLSILSIDGSSGTATFSGVIQDGSGQLELIVSGTGGTQVLTGTNTYTGSTSVENSGTLTIGNGGSLTSTTVDVTASTSTFNVLSGGTLATGTGITDDGTVVLSNTSDSLSTLNGSGGTLTLTGTMLTVTGGGALSSAIEGTGSLTVTSNILALTGVNGYSGGTTISSGGTVQINADSGLGNTSGSVTLNSGTLELLGGNNTSTTRNFALGTSGNIIKLDASSNYTISGTISNQSSGGTLTVNAASGDVLALTGNNSYSGGTTINGGTLQINSSSSLGNGGSVTINAATLEDTANVTDNRGVVLGSTSSKILVDSTFALTLGGVISGTGSLNFNSPGGTLTLSGSMSNTYSTSSSGPTTTVTAGTLDLDKSGAIAINSGSGSKSNFDVLINGGTVNFQASSQINTTANVDLTSGTFNLSTFSQTLYDFTNSGGTLENSRGSHFTVTDPTWAGGVNSVGPGAVDDFTYLTISAGSNTVHGDESGAGGGFGGLLDVGSGGLTFTGNTSPNLTINSDATCGSGRPADPGRQRELHGHRRHGQHHQRGGHQQHAAGDHRLRRHDPHVQHYQWHGHGAGRRRGGHEHGDHGPDHRRQRLRHCLARHAQLA